MKEEIVMKQVLMVVCLSLLLLLSGGNGWAALPTVVPSPTPTVVAPVDYPLPYPGILPDHPLYFIKVLRDRILGWVISDPIKNVEFNLLMADKRLVMGESLVEEGKGDLAVSTISKGEKYFDKAMGGYFSVVQSRKEDMSRLKGRLMKASVKHREVIKDLSKKDPQRRSQWEAFLAVLEKHTDNLENMK